MTLLTLLKAVCVLMIVYNLFRIYYQFRDNSRIATRSHKRLPLKQDSRSSAGDSDSPADRE